MLDIALEKETIDGVVTVQGVGCAGVRWWRYSDRTVMPGGRCITHAHASLRWRCSGVALRTYHKARWSAVLRRRLAVTVAVAVAAGPRARRATAGRRYARFDRRARVARRAASGRSSWAVRCSGVPIGRSRPRSHTPPRRAKGRSRLVPHRAAWSSPFYEVDKHVRAVVRVRRVRHLRAVVEQLVPVYVSRRAAQRGNDDALRRGMRALWRKSRALKHGRARCNKACARPVTKRARALQRSERAPCNGARARCCISIPRCYQQRTSALFQEEGTPTKARDSGSSYHHRRAHEIRCARSITISNFKLDQTMKTPASWRARISID